jgi:hypothetical protein
MTAIPDDWVEEVRSGDLSGPLPHDLLDWLAEECLRLKEELALTFEQVERLAAALADVFKRMSDEEFSARYRDIEAGLWTWSISYNCVAGSGLIFEWAGFPLLVSDVDLL